MSIAEIIAGWTREQKAEAVGLLLKFPMDPEPFLAWAGASDSCPNEYCILNPSRTHILLFTRPADDPFYAGQWHVTGGVKLPGQDSDFVWERLSTGDKYGLKTMRLGKPYKIGAIDSFKGSQSEGGSPRGSERNFIFVVESLDGMPEPRHDGTWFPLDDLPLQGPEALIGHHQRYIREILKPWIGKMNYFEWKRESRR